MNVKSLVFRLRAWIFPVLYLLGFLAPWDYFFLTRRPSTLWLAASTYLARTGWMGLAASSLLVTIVALCLCFSGAILRIWGSAYLPAPALGGGALRDEGLAIAGPYRYLRHPLYLGNCLFAAGVAILMPPDGALFFLVALCLFHVVLISAEEAFLAGRLGDRYRDYRLRVPRFLPKFAGGASLEGLSFGERRPRWLRALLLEIFPLGFAICFAILAWRYNAQMLIKCLIICYGLSLIALALSPGEPGAVESEIV